MNNTDNIEQYEVLNTHLHLPCVTNHGMLFLNQNGLYANSKELSDKIRLYQECLKDIDDDLIFENNIAIITSRKKDEKRKKLNNDDRKSGYVYLIKCQKYYKIGCATNVSNRMNVFTVEMPFKFKLIKKWKADNMYISEKLLHKKYKDKKVNGEWFNLTDNDIVMIGTIMKYEGAKQ